MQCHECGGGTTQAQLPATSLAWWLLDHLSIALQRGWLRGTTAMLPGHQLSMRPISHSWAHQCYDIHTQLIAHSHRGCAGQGRLKQTVSVVLDAVPHHWPGLVWCAMMRLKQLYGCVLALSNVVSLQGILVPCPPVQRHWPPSHPTHQQ